MTIRSSLAPSIQLVAQTLREWTAQSATDLRASVVCSDTKASRAAEDDKAAQAAEQQRVATAETARAEEERQDADAAEAANVEEEARRVAVVEAHLEARGVLLHHEGFRLAPAGAWGGRPRFVGRPATELAAVAGERLDVDGLEPGRSEEVECQLRGGGDLPVSRKGDRIHG